MAEDSTETVLAASDRNTALDSAPKSGDLLVFLDLFVWELLDAEGLRVCLSRGTHGKERRRQSPHTGNFSSHFLCLLSVSHHSGILDNIEYL